jgi:hypothetical protein
MLYSHDKFLKPLTPNDNTIQILEDNGTLKYTLNPFSVVDLTVNVNLLNVKLKSGKTIPLEFSNIANAQLAFTALKLQLDRLTRKTPIFIDKDVENYVDDKLRNGTMVNTEYSLMLNTLDNDVNNIEGDINVIESDINIIETRLDSSTIDYLDLYLRLTDNDPNNDPTPAELGLSGFGLTGS